MSVAYLFPGQGSQSVGMGRVLYARYPSARAVFDQADDALGFKLSELCIDGSEAELTATENQQPAVFVTGMAAWAVMQAHGWPRADYLAGHSLGELTALTAAGSLSFAAGLYLARERGCLMARLSRPGAMFAILGLHSSILGEIVTQVAADTGQTVTLASDNSPVQQIVSGEVAAVEAVGKLAKERGARSAKRLPITIASHCGLMDAVSAEFAQILSNTPINSPQIPVISNLTAQAFKAPREIRTELSQQLVQGVRWRESMLTLQHLGTNTFIDAGPSDTMAKLMRRIDRTTTRIAFDPANLTYTAS